MQTVCIHNRPRGYTRTCEICPPWQPIQYADSVRRFSTEGRLVEPEPIDECDACGADLFVGIVHHCDVGGNDVLIEDGACPKCGNSDWIGHNALGERYPQGQAICGHCATYRIQYVGKDSK